MSNLFHLPQNLPRDREHLEILARGTDLRVERILSTGQTTPEGAWYDSSQSEWVALLQGRAELTFTNGTVRLLEAGDWLTIAPHDRHRVTYTSSDPACVWLAVYFEGGTVLEF